MSFSSTKEYSEKAASPRKKVAAKLPKVKTPKENPDKEKEVDDDDDLIKIIPNTWSGHKIELSTKECPITAVTVYNDRAEVVRTLTVDLQAGDTQILISGLTQKIDPNSIRVAGAKGAATLLEVSGNVTYTKDKDTTKVDQLKKELEDKRDEINKKNKETTRIEHELTWLNGWATSLMKPNSQTTEKLQVPALDSLSHDNLMKTGQFLDYYQKKLEDIDNRKNAVKTAIEALQKEVDRITKEIASLSPSQSTTPSLSPPQAPQQFVQPRINQYEKSSYRNDIEADVFNNFQQVQPLQQQLQNEIVNNNKVQEIIIVVYAKEPTKLTLKPAYVVFGARWQATYDIRVNSSDSNNSSSNSKLELSYYANIYNSTNEDWNDVTLSLSTAQPNVGGTPPEIHTKIVTLRYDPPASYAYGSYSKKSAPVFYEQGEQIMEKKSRRYDKVDKMHVEKEKQEQQTETMEVITTTAKESTLNSTFLIPRKATVASDSKAHKVTVTIISLAATFTYTITPKLSPHAYLRADIINTEKSYPLLSGGMNVFMDGNFVARSEFPGVHPGEKVSVYLGTDPTIKFEYQPLKQLKDTKGIIQKTNTMKVKYNTVVSNTKSKDIKLVMWDSLPKSNDHSIKVDIVAPQIQEDDETVTLIESSNTIQWTLTVKASSKLEIPFMYNIEYPSNKDIDNAC